MKLQPIEIDWRPGEDLSALRDREWLVTNGLGGFASGSLLGINTRRHHGLFVPNLANPKGRHILISRFDEEIDARGRHVKIGAPNTWMAGSTPTCTAASRDFGGTT